MGASGTDSFVGALGAEELLNVIENTSLQAEHSDFSSLKVGSPNENDSNKPSTPQKRGNNYIKDFKVFLCRTYLTKGTLQSLSHTISFFLYL